MACFRTAALKPHHSRLAARDNQPDEADTLRYRLCAHRERTMPAQLDKERLWQMLEWEEKSGVKNHTAS